MAEVELKFDLSPQAQRAFAELPALAQARPTTRKLFALYFDTPTHDLAAHRMAMRLRRSGRQWKQCLKAGGSGAGGLHAREEWELDRPDASIDLSLFAQTPLAQLPEAERLHEKLAEVFRVEVERTTWEVEIAPGTRVEIALDHGEVRNAEGAEAISEVEIESLEGEPLAVFEMAERLIDMAALRPSAISKAQRGYRLARRERPAPVKSRPARVQSRWSAHAAARAALAAALAHLQANDTGALSSPDPEYLHQVRVAFRRLRAALRIFRDVDRVFMDAARAELQAIARDTGPARDWDVLAMETLPPILATLDTTTRRKVGTRVAARRRAARTAMRETLASPAYARLVLSLSRWLAQPPSGEDEAGIDLKEMADGALRKLGRKLARRSRHPRDLSDEERHRLRIAGKRLRYAAEGLAGLYPRKRVKAWLDGLEKLQDDLGRANDVRVARALLEEIDAPAAFLAAATRHLDEEDAKALEKLAPHAHRIATATPFWEK